ncbi:MAG: multinuclear nonheme iron-dependent oxidase [Sulfuriferula sp.]
MNHQFDPLEYLRAIPAEAVQEIHLAGFDSNGECLIDTHGKAVCDDVWALYAQALALVGNVPTLIEWDTDIPALSVLLEEAGKADILLQRSDDHAQLA